MYAPPPTASSRRTGLAAGGPLLAICCLLFILFLVAATIILALIPVYVSKDGTSARTTMGTFVMTSKPGTVNGKRADTELFEGTLDATSGTLIGLAIDKALGLTSGATNPMLCRNTGVIQRRKRRGFASLREPRATGIVKTYCTFYFLTTKCSKCSNAGYIQSLKPFDISTVISYTGSDGVTAHNAISVTYTVVIYLLQTVYPGFSTAAPTSAMG